MTHLAKTAIGFVEHALVMLVGFVMMVVGLGMGVSMVLLPFGLVIGLLGFAIFIGGLVGKIEKTP
jgi:hypothetical protein